MKIEVDLEKWENLVRLAKAAGRMFDGNEPGDEQWQKEVREKIRKEYDDFCDWRHEEPYFSGNFERAKV
jgi:hypothetical protein